MLAAADKKNFVECLNIASQMKVSGIIPDISAYNCLLSAAADDGGQWLEAWAILDDMILGGVKPNITSFNHLLRAQRGRSSVYMWAVVQKMEQMGISADTHFYTQIIDRFVQDKNLEMAVQYLFVTKEVGLVPQLQAAEAVVALAAEQGHPRLAIDLIEWFEEESVRRMDHRPWLSCLIASAHDFYADGVMSSWDVVTKEFKIVPDEGLCIDVLNTCARHGLVSIAQNVLDALKSMNVSMEEYHYAPAVQAAATGQDLEKGLSFLNDMTLSNVTSTPHTVLPMIHAIEANLDTLDSAITLIDNFYRKGVKLTSVPLRVVISAAVSLDDLQRAVGMYKSFSEYNVVPDLSTYNVLLEGCVNAAHRQLGDLLLNDMKQLKVKPDRDTYEQLVRLCMTQETYEDAFFYLEEMKAAGHVPSVKLYEVIIQTCIANEDPRYNIAVEEIQECGYAITPRLRGALNSISQKGGIINEEAQDGKQVWLDEATQKYIETGGVKTRL
ncbi:hypothetical protein BDQ17DRAFT_1240470 [Cyathus striatus]|nr:hypothetical protein BDQ17DRAFT_1240470 [Cyathus striatus]